MDYSSQYRKASFRAAEFWPTSGGDGGGRRNVTHEYPERDKSSSDDLGKKSETFNIKGFVAGKNFKAEAKLLIAACRKPGPGMLIHPLYGAIEVSCESWNADWTTQEEGYVGFDFEFKEYGEIIYPADNADYTELAAEKAGASLETFQGFFSELINLKGPGWISEALAQDLDAALSMVSQVISVASPIGSSVAQALSIVEQAQALAAGGANAAQGAAGIIGQGLGAINSLAEDSNPAAALWAALETSKFGSEASEYGGALTAIAETTASRAIQAANREAFTALVERLAVTHGIQAALSMDLDNSQQAAKVRGQVVDRLNQLMFEAGDNGDDEGFLALQSLQVTTIKAFDAKIAKLQPLVQVRVPTAVTSALTMAAELYGGAERADEICSRNPGVMHPGFLPSGDDVEVLRA